LDGKTVRCAALLHPDGDALERRVDRYVLAQAVVLSLRGVPAFYFASVFASETWKPESGVVVYPRDLIRERYDSTWLSAQLHNPLAVAGKVFARLQALVDVRRQEPCFAPQVPQRVLTQFGDAVFALERGSVDGASPVLALHNVSEQPVVLSELGSGNWTDLITARPVTAATVLPAFGVLWLR
jgi:hypothetical protein